MFALVTIHFYRKETTMELRALLMSNDLLTVRTPNNALW